jgi:hypothetical protein
LGARHSTVPVTLLVTLVESLVDFTILLGFSVSLAGFSL